MISSFIKWIKSKLKYVPPPCPRCGNLLPTEDIPLGETFVYCEHCDVSFEFYDPDDLGWGSPVKGKLTGRSVYGKASR